MSKKKEIPEKEEEIDLYEGMNEFIEKLGVRKLSAKNIEIMAKYYQKLFKKYKDLKDCNVRTIGQNKRLKRLVKGVSISTLALGVILGTKNPELLKKLWGKVTGNPRVEIGEMYNSESGKTNFCIINEKNEKNKKDATLNVTLFGIDGEKIEKTVSDGTVISQGYVYTNKLDRLLENQYIVPAGRQAKVRTSLMKSEDNVARIIEEGDAFFGTLPIYSSAGNGSQGIASEVFIPGVEGNQRFYVFLDEAGIITPSENEKDVETTNVVVKRDTDIYTSPESGIVNAHALRGASLRVTKDSKEDPIGDTWFKSGWFEVTDENGNTIGFIHERDIEIENELEGKNTIADKILSNTRFNEDRNCITIDSRDMEADQLSYLIDNYEVPSTMDVVVDYENAIKEEYNTSRLAGCNISHVFIRAGASKSTTGEIESKCTDFVGLAEVCSNKNIPYSLYFYSTSVSIEEADKELEKIREGLQAIKEMGIEPPVNFFVDSELASGDELDRQAGHDVTNTKIYMIKAIQDTIQDIFGPELDCKVGLYTTWREVNPDSSERILDLGAFTYEFGEDFPLWTTNLIDSEGNLINEEVIEYFNKHGEIFSYQTVHDVDIDGTYYDFGEIPEEAFRETLENYGKELDKKEDEEETQIIENVNSILGTTYSWKEPEVTDKILPEVVQDDGITKEDVR